MKTAVVRLKQPLQMSNFHRSFHNLACSSFERRIKCSHSARGLMPTNERLNMSTTKNVVIRGKSPPTNLAPPLLSLPPGMPIDAGHDDSALLKALTDYQVEHRRKLSERLSESTQLDRLVIGIVGRIVRAAECALLVLDRMPQPRAEEYRMVINAWCHASEATASISFQSEFKGFPQRAELIIQRMQQQKVLVTTEDCNSVLKLWANSKEHLRGFYCERFFQKSFNTPPQSSTSQQKPIRPDANSYRWIIRTWAKSNENEEAFRSMEHILKWRESDVEPPQLEDFRVVLEQWSDSHYTQRYIHAWMILKSMLEWENDKRKVVRPDSVCYGYCLKTLARTYLPDLGLEADKILKHMMERHVLPDTTCYTYAIRTWKNTALIAKNPQQLYLAAARTHALLDDMSAAFQRSSSVVVKPSTDVCNDVLRAWHAAASRHDNVVEKSEEILTIMEQSTDPQLAPNVHSYRLVLDTLALQKRPLGMAKLKRADELLERMRKHVRETLPAPTSDARPAMEAMNTDIHHDQVQDDGRTTAAKEAVNEDGKEDEDLSKPAVAVFNAYLRVCASVKVEQESDKVEVLRKAFEVLDAMENDPKLELHSGTFQAFLDVIATTTGQGTNECSYAAERVFQKCCRHGLLNKFVLKTFRQMVPQEVFQRVVLDRSTRDGSELKWLVPQEWTRHSNLPTMIMEGGHQQLPLTVEGKHFVPPEALDYKARNLRERKGQKLLQGGRIFRNNSH